MRCHLKIFLIYSSCRPFSLNIFYFNFVRYTYTYIQVTECKRSPFVRRSGIICAILVEGIMRNIFSEISLNLDQWFRRCRLKKKIA